LFWNKDSDIILKGNSSTSLVSVLTGEDKTPAPLGALELSPETGEGCKNSLPVPIRQKD